jgi:uncharacterized protein YukE
MPRPKIEILNDFEDFVGLNQQINNRAMQLLAEILLDIRGNLVTVAKAITDARQTNEQVLHHLETLNRNINLKLVEKHE